MRWLHFSCCLLLAALSATYSGCGGAENASGDAAAEHDEHEHEHDHDHGNDEAAGEAIDLSYLSAEDQAAAKKQGFCPVGGKDVPLGSGGMKAVKVTVEGRDVFLCCEGCESALRAEPEKYFALLDGKEPPTEEEAAGEKTAEEAEAAEAADKKPAG